MDGGQSIITYLYDLYIDSSNVKSAGLDVGLALGTLVIFFVRRDIHGKLTLDFHASRNKLPFSVGGFSS